MLRPQTNLCRTFIEADGIWNFRRDADKRGMRKRWFEALPSPEMMAVPGSWNSQGVTTEEKGKRHITTQTVTLLVDPEGAEAVALGLAQGEIHLVLRNPVDMEIVDVSPTNTRKVLGMAPEKKATRKRPVYRKPKPKPAPPKPEPEPKKDPSFTIIRDGNITKQNSPNSGEKP